MTLKFDPTSIRIGIIGLGYVGLLLAVEFGKKIHTALRHSCANRNPEQIRLKYFSRQKAQAHHS